MTTGNEEPPLTFVGMHSTDNEYMSQIDQDFYISKIEQSPNDVEFGKLASMSMRLAGLTNTRSNLAFEVSQVAQIAQAMFDQDVSKHRIRLNKAIKYAHDSKS